MNGRLRTDARRRADGGAGGIIAVRSDRGSATVWSVGAIAVLCAVFGAGLALGQAVVVRHRAAGAADLAALAAADHWAEGRAEACAHADRVALAQGARLVRCTLTGTVSDVTAAWAQGPLSAQARARAGPPAPTDTAAVNSGPADTAALDSGPADTAAGNTVPADTAAPGGGTG